MKIQEIDKHLAVNTDITEPDMVWFNAREYPFTIHGVMYDEDLKRYTRFPMEVAKTVSKAVEVLNTNTSGGRVRFKTDSSYIAIRSVMEAEQEFAHMSYAGSAGFDMYRNLDGRETYFNTFVPPLTMKEGYSGGIKTYGELTDYTINFPLYDGVCELYIGLKKGATLDVATPYEHSTPIVFYGNSITQGGCASRPGNSYQGFLSRRLSTDFINLGFSGAGKGEQEMAEYIAGLDMSILFMDYDANSPTEETLRATHYPFYKTVRDSNPDIPIIFMSHIGALHGVDISQLTVWGSADVRRGIIEETYLRAKAEGDNNVYFIDRKEVLKGEEWDACTVDGCHPNDFGFLRIAQYLEKILKPLL